MKKRLLATLLSAVMLFTFAACGSPSTPTDTTTAATDTTTAPTSQGATEPATQEPAAEKVFRFAELADIRNVNPHNGNYITENNARAYLSGRLYRGVINPETQGIMYVPEMASELPIEIGTGGTVWQIKLNPDAVWENGEGMNADTWIYTFKMACDPVMVNPMGSWVYSNEISILNGEKYYLSGGEGAEPCTWEEVGVKKIDDYTIELTLSERYSQMNVIRHFAGVAPVYEPYYEAGMSADKSSTTYATTKESFMASGPYKLTFWEKDSERVYEKNPLWPLEDMIKIDKITYNIVPDSGTQLQLFEAGEIDYMDLDATTYERFKQDPRLLTYPSTVVTMLFLNMANPDNPLMSNVNFRKAIYWGTDRDTLATLQSNKPWPMFLHELAGGYPEENILYKDLPEVQARWPENNGYDPVKAKEYFDLAYAELGLSGKASINFIYNEASATTKSLCEFMQSSLPKVFGEDLFEVTATAVPGPAFTAAVLDWESNPAAYEICFGSWAWSTTLYMPNYQFQFYTPSGQLNTTDYGSPDLDEMYVRSLTEEYRFDQEKLIGLTMEMDELFMERMLAVPVTQGVGKTIISERVILPLAEYDPFLGFATLYADIDVTK